MVDYTDKYNFYRGFAENHGLIYKIERRKAVDGAEFKKIKKEYEKLTRGYMWKTGQTEQERAQRMGVLVYQMVHLLAPTEPELLLRLDKLERKISEND